MKGISLILSSVKQKSGKKRSRRKQLKESTKQDENLVIESKEKSKENLKIEGKPKKKVKKIRIRLADPNIPDSYICEVFDSSLEQDERGKNSGKREMQKKSVKSSNLKEKSKSKSKPKDYFDVLMSKDSRRNVKLNTTLQSKEQKKFVRDSDSDDLLTNCKIIREKRKGKLVEMTSKVNSSNEYCTSTSDDESLFQVQSKIKLISSNSKSKNCSEKVCSAKNGKKNERDFAQEDSELSPTNGNGSVKKNKPNILNYFSKTDPRKTTSNGQVKTMKYSDIKVLEKIKSINMENITVVDDSKSVRRNEVVTLAPLFQKKTKNVIDPKIQKARLEFLQNGLPTIMKKMCNNRKSLEEKYSPFLFPAISHVQQRDDDPMWTSTSLCIPPLKAVEENQDFVPKKIFRFEICENTDRNLNEAKKQSLDLGNLRSKYRDLNVEFIFNSFREKREIFFKKMEETSLIGTKYTSNGFVKYIDDREGCNSLWTDIYKPKSSEIIGNKQTVSKLSDWLKSWKEYSYKIINSNVKVENKVLGLTDDSDDDFVSSKDKDYGLRAPKNVCLLSGPIGSGKTTLVYALASELDYSVLEVNASSKRTGKKLLLDLQEATKSHEVSSGFGPLTENKRKQPQIKTIKSKKKKVRKQENETKRNLQSNGKISLILIEDADIYFEDHDEGFVSAISTLVQSTKRPFIFLSNDPNYGYLERFKVQQVLMLEMRRPDFLNSCAVLDVMAILEGVYVEKETLGNLIQNNQYDLRKSILELQFWIQSGKNLKQHKFFELGKLWWGFNKFLFTKDSVHRLKLNYRKRKRTSDLYDSSSGEEETSKKAKLNVGNVKTSKSQPCEKKIDPSIHAYSKILDSVSITDLFKLEGDPEPIPSNEFRPKDGLSLNECMESFNWKVKNLSKLIANEFITVSTNFFVNSCRDHYNSDYIFCSPPWEETIWRNMHQKAKFDLMSLVPSNIGCSKRILHLDYLPTLRNICRTEKIRYHGNTKRKNRFCHYFRSLGFNPRDDSLDISCDILEY